jgi:aspartyl-tRNA synthetase
VVKAIRVPGGAEKLTRKMTDGYGEFVKQFGAGGVPVVKSTPTALRDRRRQVPRAPIKDELIAKRLGLEPGDTVLFGADTYGRLHQGHGRAAPEASPATSW